MLIDGRKKLIPEMFTEAVKDAKTEFQITLDIGENHIITKFDEKPEHLYDFLLSNEIGDRIVNNSDSIIILNRDTNNQLEFEGIDYDYWFKTRRKGKVRNAIDLGLEKEQTKKIVEDSYKVSLIDADNNVVLSTVGNKKSIINFLNDNMMRIVANDYKIRFNSNEPKTLLELANEGVIVTE